MSSSALLTDNAVFGRERTMLVVDIPDLPPQYAQVMIVQAAEKKVPQKSIARSVSAI